MSSNEVKGPKSKILWLTVTIILLIAFFFRFYQLDHHPLGITFDPAINGLDAVRLMQRGGSPIFFPTNGGREPLHVYSLIPSIRLFSTTPFAIRAVTSTLNFLSVAFLFAFLYYVPQWWPFPTSSSDKQDRFWLAALGSLALAVSYWHIMTGRLGLRTELATLISIPMFWFFCKGWSGGQRRWVLLSGLLMGTLGYTYSAARLLPVILVMTLIPEFTVIVRSSLTEVQKKELKTRFINVATLAAIATTVYLPMAWYTIAHPAQFTERAFSVMIWNFLDTPVDIIAEMGRNAVRIAGFFCCVGSPNPTFGLPDYPGSHPVVLPFLLLGLAGTLISWRHLFPRLVLLWWIIGLAPSIITIEAPHPLRMVMAVVPTAILIALGPIYLARWLAVRIPSFVPSRVLLAAMVVIVIPVYGNSVAYFSDWTGLQTAQGVFDYGSIAIRDAINEQANDGKPIYLPLSRLNFPTLLFYLSGRFQRQASFAVPPSEPVLIIAPDRNFNDSSWVRFHNGTATILPPLNEAGQKLVQSALAGKARTAIQTVGGETVAYIAQSATDPARDIDQPTRRLEASFGPIDLLGVSYPATIGPAAELPVTLFWQANHQIPNEYELLVRLVDDKQQVWGNGDGRPTDWVYPTTFWRPGIDKIAVQNTIVIDSEPPGPGRYWLAVSIFDPTVNQRLALTAGGSSSPDTLLVGPLKVPLHSKPPPGLTFIAQPVNVGELAQLASFALDKSTIKPGEVIQLTLLWHVLSRPDLDYTIFLHLLDSDGNLVAGNDTQPVSGLYPTTIWTPGERIIDSHSLTTPESVSPGQYRLAIGLYHQPTGQRLPLHLPNGLEDAQGRFVLEQIVTIN